MGQPTHAVEFEALAEAFGIQRVHSVDPYNVGQVEQALRDCVEAKGPAVVVSRRECALLPEARAQWMALVVDETRCNGCGLCFEVGCPAIVKGDPARRTLGDGKAGREKATIDQLLCTGCEICAQVCARGAIHLRADVVERETASV
jgi:indolepyruvate ferredoxin oxidoreductase alpha subunit